MGFTSLHNGEIGEYICALRLLQMGVPCRIVNMGTTDIIAEYENRPWRIQVKSSIMKGYDGLKDKRKSYQFGTSKGGKKTPFSITDFDICALVAIDRELVYFTPVHKVCNQVTKRMTPSKFHPHVSMHSWMNCMKYFRDNNL